MANNTNCYAEVYVDSVSSRSNDVVVSGSKPNTGYTIVVSAGIAKAVRWKFCPPVFTDFKQTKLKVDPAIALTNLLWGKCACGYKVKDFASVVMGHKKTPTRELVCPLCRGSFPIRRCDMVLVGDANDPAKDVVYQGAYAKEMFDGVLFNAANPATDELVLPKLWFGYKPSESPFPGFDTGDNVAGKGFARNSLAYYEFDSVRELHYKDGAPSVRSIMLECRARTGMTTVAALAGDGLPYTRTFFKQLYGR